MIATITTRAAMPDDADACAEILQEWIDETPWFLTQHPDSAAAVMLQSEINEFGFTLAVENQKIAGFSCLAKGVLQFLYIRKEYRNKGVGLALLDGCKSGLPSGFDLWTFQQNTGARRFYERHGFVEVERTDGSENEEHLPDIRYRWEGENV